MTTRASAGATTSRCLRGLMLGYDVDSRAARRAAAAELAAGLATRGRRRRRRDPDLVRRRARPARRPSPTCGCCSGGERDEADGTSCRCAPPRSTSTPTCARSTSRARGCRPTVPRRLAPGAAALRRGRPRPGHRPSRRRCTGSTSRSSGSTPRSRSSSTILKRWLEQGPQGEAIDDARRRHAGHAGRGHASGAIPTVADLAREVRFAHRRRTPAACRPRRDVRRRWRDTSPPSWRRPGGDGRDGSHGRARRPARNRSRPLLLSRPGDRRARPPVPSCSRR